MRMTIRKAEVRLGEAFNKMPGKEVVEKHLAGLPYGVAIVDGDRSYWQNAEDTLVFQIDGGELYRFGGNIIEAIASVWSMVYSTGADEVHTSQQGSKLTVRMWWD